MFQNNLLMAAASIGAGGLTVDNSVRFNDDDSPRLFRTPAVLGNRWTSSISLWFKRCNLGSIQQLYNAGAGNDITFNASDKLTFVDGSTQGTGTNYITTQVFRDPTAWGHLLFAWDTTLATAGDRLRIYYNGVEITAFDTETNPTLNSMFPISNVVRQTIGANESDTEEFDGYLSQVHYVDGIQNVPTDFGEFSSNGVWRPIEFAADGTGYSGNVVLIMTSATAPSGTVTVSGTYSTYYGFRAFDNVPASALQGWINTPLAGWIAYEFTSSKTITMYTITSRDSVMAPEDWTFEGWDGSAWVVLDTVTGENWTTGIGEIKVYTFSNTTAYIKYQLDCTEVQNAGDNLAIMNLTMHEDSSGYGTNGFFLDFADSSLLGLDAAVSASTTTYRYLKIDVTEIASTSYLALQEMEYYVGATLYPTQTMTSNTAPSPLVASANSDNVGNEAYFAFNDVLTGADWLTANTVVTGYLKIDLGSGNGIAPTSFRLGAPETPDRTPNDFTIQGSNNDSDWTILATYAGMATPTPTARTFLSQAPMSNGNNFLSSGLAVADQVTDTPTDNFCVMSPIDKSSSITLSDGNLTSTGSGGWYHGSGTLFASSGKWYYEWTPDSGSYALAGWITNIPNDHQEEETDPETAQYRGIGAGAGLLLGSQSNITGLANFAVDDVVMMAIDIDTGKVWVGIDGTWEGDQDPATGTATGTWTTFTGTAFTPWTGQFSNANTFNFGQTAFAHTVPTGFSAWSTANLPAPQRTGGKDSQFVGAYDTGANIVATLDAAKDATWTNYINMYRQLTAGVGANWQFSDDTSNQLTLPGPSPGAKSAFINPSVTGASNNWNGYSWQVGTEYGLYTAEISHTNGADTDQAHGLTSDSSRFMAHSKRSDAADEWWIVHPDLTSGNNINFYWSVEVATEYVTVDGTNVTVKSTNATGTYRVIVWAEMSGWRKFGKFEGNTNVDGPFLWVGGTPKLHVGKRSTSGEDYHSNLRARDPIGNPMTYQVALDWTSVESTAMPIDGTAGGVKIRTVSSPANGPAMITWQECTPFGGAGVAPATAV